MPTQVYVAFSDETQATVIAWSSTSFADNATFPHHGTLTTADARWIAFRALAPDYIRPALPVEA